MADFLVVLTEVTKPYQLGIQLKIDLAELDSIERNHPRDVDRQKIEVIKYWLHNSPDPSWTTLASAVERMGGQAMLAETLREKEQSSDKQLLSTLHVPSLTYQRNTYNVISHRKRIKRSKLSPLDTCGV